MKQGKWLRIEGVNVVLYEDEENTSMERKISVREETRQNRHPKPRSLGTTNTKGRSASRKRNFRGWSPSGKFARQPRRDYLKGICTESRCECWHHLQSQLYNFWIGMQIRWQVLACTQASWRSTQQRTEKGWWQKCNGFSERCTTVGLRFSGCRAAGIITIFLRKKRKVLGINSTSTITKATQRHANIQ